MRAARATLSPLVLEQGIRHPTPAARLAATLPLQAFIYLRLEPVTPPYRATSSLPRPPPMPFINSPAAAHPRLPVALDTGPSTRFIAALILPSAAGSGALAVFDHAGELILCSPLPGDPTHDARDREGLLAHLTHFVPNLAAVTDVVVSHLPTPADLISPAEPITSRLSPDGSPLPTSSARLLRLLAWLGPAPHVVAPATWLDHHGVRPGSTETLRQACARRLPGLLLPGYGPRVTDAVQAAVLLGHFAHLFAAGAVSA